MAERKPPARRTTKRATTPRKRGERIIPITDEMIREAERAARAGHTDREIIDHLGISTASFYNWRNTGDAWREKNRAAIENGDPAPAIDARTTRCVEDIASVWFSSIFLCSKDYQGKKLHKHRFMPAIPPIQRGRSVWSRIHRP